MKNILIKTRLGLLLGLVASVVLVVTSCTCGGSSTTLNLPIELKDATNVGSLQFEFMYDASSLQVSEVNTIDIGKNAMVETNSATPGLIVIGIIDSSGMNGSGPVVNVSFDIVEEGGNSDLIISAVQANDVDTLIDIPVTITNGKFNEGNVDPPVIQFE